MYKRGALLNLRHSDISTTNGLTASSSTGSWYSGRGFTTWNVNLKRCLADIWKPGQVYQLRLNQWGHDASTFYTTEVENAFCHFKISGLDWVGSSYSVATNSTEREAILMTREIGVATESYDLNPNVGVLYFRASSAEVAHISIELIRASDNLAAESDLVTPNYFPASIYNLSITPVE